MHEVAAINVTSQCPPERQLQFATVALARDVELLLSGRPPRRIRGPARNQDLELDLEIARGSKQGGILVLSANASHSKLRVVS